MTTICVSEADPVSSAELLGVRADSGGSLTAVRPARLWLTAHSLPTSLSTPRGERRRTPGVTRPHDRASVRRRPGHQPVSLPMTTSPSGTISRLTVFGTTAAVIGNSTGA